MNKFQSYTDTSIVSFLGINSKLTLRNVLKEKIDKIYTWLDLDDDDTKPLTKERTSNLTLVQKIVILTYDIYNNVSGTGIEEDRITTTIYEIRTSPEHAPILKCILYSTNPHTQTTILPSNLSHTTSNKSRINIYKRR